MNPLKSLFLLDPSITYLNFGSFGACPKPIFEVYQNWQLRLERSPVHFIVHDAIEGLEITRRALGEYVGADFMDLVMVTNPSYAINTIAKSLPLNAGDEILTTNLEYGACDRTWEYYCEKRGATFVKQEISLPIASEEEFLKEFWQGYTDKTKVVFISHITSATGLILPVEALCAEAKKRGLLTIVDGAHVPGHVPLDLSTLQADVYTGACHKWMMGPKGSSFLYVNKANQGWVDPLLISWGFRSDFPSESTFIDYHQTAGTRDYAAFLTVPTCLTFMEQYHWDEVSHHCKKETLRFGEQLTDLLGTRPLAPLTAAFYGQLFSAPIRTQDPIALKKQLFEEFRIEIPVVVQHDAVYLRFSYQAFNSEEDMQQLFAAVEALMQSGAIQRG